MLAHRTARAMLHLGGSIVLGVAVGVFLTWSDVSFPPLPTVKGYVLDTDGLTHSLFLPLMPKLCPYAYVSPRPRLVGSASLPGQVTFRNPLHCTIGWSPSTMITANGDYSDTLNYTIWILAYGADSLYYPQSPNACVGAPMHQENGFWTVPTYLGLPGGPPEWFDLVAIVADNTASQFLSNWLDTGCDNGYIGIPASMFATFNISEKVAISIQTTD